MNSEKEILSTASTLHHLLGLESSLIDFVATGGS